MSKIVLFFYLVVLCLLTNENCFADNWKWLNHITGANDIEITDINIDQQNNVIIFGAFQGVFEFVNSGGVTMTSSAKVAFLAKYTNLGDFVWANQIGVADKVTSRAMAMDGNNNIYITAGFSGTGGTVFYSQNDQNDTITSTGNEDVYIAKYDIDGNLIWALDVASGTGLDRGMGLTLDASDNIIICGFYKSTTLDFGGGNTLDLTSGVTNNFIAKFDNNGTFIWSINIDGDGETRLNRITTCADEGFIGAGGLKGTIFTGETYEVTSAGSNDVFILKVNNSGDVSWVRVGGSTSDDVAHSCTSDDEGNIYLTGLINGVVTFDSTATEQSASVSCDQQDSFVAKYDKDGILQWLRNGVAGNDRGRDIFYKDNYVYVSGYFLGENAVWNQDTLSALNYLEDIYVSKYSSDGNIVGAVSIVGKYKDDISQVAVENGGYIYLGGFFKSDTLYAGENMLVNMVSTGSTKDLFVAKSCPIIGINPTITDVSCYGDNDGEIDLTITGDAEPYTFSWSGGATVEDITGLTAGYYTVTISYDSDNCTKSATYKIEEPGYTTSITPTSCNNGTDGEAIVTPSNGLEPYTYAWETGGTDSTASNLSAGWWTFTLTDATPCTIIDSVEITEPDTMTYTVTVYIPESSGGTNDGAITITPSGIPPYAYAWEGLADIDSSVTNLTAGWYKFTITDACESLVDSVEIIVGNPLLYSITYQTNVTCYSGNDGEAIVTPTGGVPPYTYNWSSGSTDSTATNLTAGRYYFTVSDIYLSVNDSVDIAQPDDLTFVINKTDLACNGDTDGEATILPSGGVLPYAFEWSTSGTDATISNLTAGLYNFTLTDACDTIVSSIQITEPDTLGYTTSVTDISCNGLTDGEVIVTPTGGAPPYTYEWATAETDSIISGLSEGWYYFTITDACESVNDSARIIEPGTLGYTTSVTDISCNSANDGIATVTPSGGVQPYTYYWSEVGATDSTITGLAQGWYHFTLTDACETYEDSVQVTEPEVLNYTTSYTDITCNGADNGIATVTPSGGALPYVYIWSPGGETDSTITGLSAGWYYFTFSDACDTLNDSIQIAEPDTLGYTTSVTDISCFGAGDGTATINPAGGVPPYAYIWLGGETNSVITGLSAGWYYFTISDACDTLNDSVQVVEPEEFTISITSSTNVSCYGGNDGEAIVTPAGGVLPYTYNWTSGSVDSTATTLTAGWYYVTVSDACGSLTDSVEITQQDSLTYIVSLSMPDCYGVSTGTATITPLTGVPPYTYEWSTSATDSTITNLGDGSYYVTLTDACVSIVDTVEIIGPDTLSLSFSVTQSYCGMNTGSIDLSVSGGTSPYTFEWSNGELTEDTDSIAEGWYTVTVTDINGCTTIDSTEVTDEEGMALILETVHTTCTGDDGRIDLIVLYGYAPYTYEWSNSETTQDIDSLNAGTYLITVTDVLGCIALDSTLIIQGDNIVLSFFAVNPTCFGINDGTVNASVNGGTPPYSFIWSNDSTTQSIDSLTAGIYIVTVTDINNCVAIDSTILYEPQLISLTLFTSNISCYGLTDGAITLIITGGTAPYTYLWNDASSATTQNISDIPSGTYTVTVTDYSGCIAVDSATVDESEELGAVVGGTDTICFNGTNGSIVLNPYGGTYPYYYTWSTGASTPDIYNLNSGTYNFTITDNYDCSFESSHSIVQTDSIGVAHTSIDISCYGFNNGTINTSASGGMPPYSYIWYDSEGITSYYTPNLNEIPAEIYIVKVTDSIGCVGYDTITITEPDQIIVYELITNIPCYGNSTGEIDLAVYGGIPDYSFLWSNGDDTQLTEDLSAGYHTVTISDQNSCTLTETYTITEPYKGIKVTGEITDVSCRDYSDGSIDIYIEYGTPPYYLNWSNDETTSLIENLGTATYYITVTDNNGCSVGKSFEIEPSEFPCLEIRNAFTPNADGTNDEWNIKGVEVYPDCTVDIYNQWGNKVFHSSGYTEPWDGKKDGNELPAGTYYYIIDLGTGDTPYTGSVSIIK